MFVFFFNDTATTEIYTLSLHDALPIFCDLEELRAAPLECLADPEEGLCAFAMERMLTEPVSRVNGCAWESNFGSCKSARSESTRLNSSHGYISYAVFCLKKKKKDLTSC